MGRWIVLVEAAPRPGRSLILVKGTPGRPAGRSRSRPAARPGVAATWCTLHFEYATTSGGACADRFWTLKSAAVTRHL